MYVRRPGFPLLSLAPTQLRDHDVPTYKDVPCLLPDQLRIYLNIYLPLLAVSIAFVCLANLVCVSMSSWRSPSVEKNTVNGAPHVVIVIVIVIEFVYNDNWRPRRWRIKWRLRKPHLFDLIEQSTIPNHCYFSEYSCTTRFSWLENFCARKPISRPTRFLSKLPQGPPLFPLVWTIPTQEEESLVNCQSPRYTRYSGLSSRRICDNHLLDSCNLIGYLVWSNGFLGFILSRIIGLCLTVIVVAFTFSSIHIYGHLFLTFWCLGMRIFIQMHDVTVQESVDRAWGIIIMYV